MSITQEFNRVRTMLSGLTTSVPIMVMDSKQVEAIEQSANLDTTLTALANELRTKLRAIKQPGDYPQMAQAYEAYSEACFALQMRSKQVLLERTPGTGQHGEKRPDFMYSHPAGKIYFELKALEIAEPLRRHKEIGLEALEVAAELDGRACKPGVHVGRALSVSGHIPGAETVSRIDDTIEKIRNNIKFEQIHYGPTVLVIDLGRLPGIPQGPSGVLPVYFHSRAPAETCVSGELWQIALGLPGEQIFTLPEFDGKSNIGGHQTQEGILRTFPGLLGMTFMLPGWCTGPKLYTIWNIGSDKSILQNPCTLGENEIGALLFQYSDGLNDERNELGWEYRKLT
jgi:hypothetical protein